MFLSNLQDKLPKRMAFKVFRKVARGPISDLGGQQWCEIECEPFMTRACAHSKRDVNFVRTAQGCFRAIFHAQDFAYEYRQSRLLTVASIGS